MDIVAAATLLFLILDPIGNVPIFLSILKGVAPERRRWVLARELLIALVILLIFLFGGKYVLAALHLRQESVSIAGGIVLFLIGIRMIFPPKDGIFGESHDGEPFIVPMAVPGVAGPSAIAAVMLLTQQDPTRQLDWTFALLIAWSATAIILFASTWLYRLLKAGVLGAMEKLMGMLLIAVSVQMFLDGVAKYLAGVAN
jgi:multiple antibiotic resistance protein